MRLCFYHDLLLNPLFDFFNQSVNLVSFSNGEDVKQFLAVIARRKISWDVIEELDERGESIVGGFLHKV